MKSLSLLTAVMGLLLSFYSTTARAQIFGTSMCQMSRDYKFNLFISPENQVSGLFGPTADRLPPTVISNCRGSAGKYLGIGLGLRQPYYSSDAADVSFDGNLREEICHIKNPPVDQIMPFTDKLKLFKEQFQLLRSCTYLELTHLDNKKIPFDANQTYCHMTQLPNGKVKAEGDFCYIRINPDLRMAISVAMKPECMNQDFLIKNNLQSRDIEALLQAFVVDDATSINTDNLIGSTKVRLAMMPDSHLVDVNKDVGPESALFPTTFASDIHMGPIIIKDGSFGDDKKTFYDLSLFVDSRTARNCAHGLCVGPGDYQMPITGEVEIYEVTPSGKRNFLDSWYSGNSADPFVKAQWQGLFRFGRKVSEGYTLEQGHTYELQVNFYNPHDDFLMFVKGYEQILVDLTLMNGTAGKDYIQPMASLNSLLGLPQLPQLPQIGSTEIEEQLEKIRQLIHKISADETFPPFYTEMCDSALKRCQKTNSTSKYLTLKTRFDLGPVNSQDGSYTLKNISVSREATFLDSYQKKVPDLPQLVCE